MPTDFEAREGYARYVVETMNGALLGYTKIADELLRKVDHNLLPLEIDIPRSFVD